jgi:DAK2 domain fusion protein YloV
MSLTLRAAREAVAALPDDAPANEVATTAVRATMIGARGNSGVILSQILRGFSEALQANETIDPGDVARGLAAAYQTAYRSVSRPVEGTILTVARKVSEEAEAAAVRGANHADLLATIVEAARLAVAATPDQLDVLRRAGVVDAGAEGFRVMLEAAWRSATGLSPALVEPTTSTVRVPLDAVAEADERPFGFCTEFLLQEARADVSDVRGAMEQMGESVIVIGDESFIRVHLHTLRPGQALEYAVDHGTVAQVKVENMMLQHRAHTARVHEASGSREPDGAPALQEGIGVVAVAPGDGLQDVFRSLGAFVVAGGQTMNPSVRELLDAIERSGHREVIVLPNNRNVISAAKQAGDVAGQSVDVIPTRTVPQGIAALLSFNFQADRRTNVAAMSRAATSVWTIEVARATRGAEIDGVSVCEGNFMGLLDGAVVSACATPEDAAVAALRHLGDRPLEIVTLYVGAGISRATADALAERLRAERTGVDVEVHHGGQPHYPFVLSLE